MDRVATLPTDERAALFRLAIMPATLQLTPADDWADFLRRDYDGMQVMLFGEAPTFDQILDGLIQCYPLFLFSFEVLSQLLFLFFQCG